MALCKTRKETWLQAERVEQKRANYNSHIIYITCYWNTFFGFSFSVMLKMWKNVGSIYHLKRVFLIFGNFELKLDENWFRFRKSLFGNDWTFSILQKLILSSVLPVQTKHIYILKIERLALKILTVVNVTFLWFLYIFFMFLKF
jgi:hypothetical protein